MITSHQLNNTKDGDHYGPHISIKHATLHDANVAQQLQEIEQMEATLALRQNALEKFDAIATASGNGAAESMRAMENNIAGTQGGLMNNNVTDASVTNVSKVENNLGNAKVDPNNSREYYNYAEAGR